MLVGEDGTAQGRTTDAANEITAVSGSGNANWVDPTYDDAGNMTLAPRPGDEATASAGLLLVYDAWNRLAKVYQDNGATSGQKDSGDTLVAEYQYDGQGRRIAKMVREVVDNDECWDRTDYYLNESWQVLEERLAVAAHGDEQGHARDDGRRPVPLGPGVRRCPGHAVARRGREFRKRP